MYAGEIKQRPSAYLMIHTPGRASQQAEGNSPALSAVVAELYSQFAEALAKPIDTHLTDEVAATLGLIDQPKP
jgi:hypothetical protein